MRTVPKQLICLLSLIFNSVLKKKNKIYNLIRSLENPLSVLNHNKAETRWDFLVVCPTTWIPAFLQPAEKILRGKNVQTLLGFCFLFPPPPAPAMI